MPLVRLALGTALCVVPVLAFAHPGHADSGLIAGMAHPLSGVDHLLAMFAVGLWAAQQTHHGRWRLPLTFVGAMLLGGLLGFDGVAIAYLEGAIAASVLALGVLVAVAARPPLAVSLVISGLFGLAHGMAHGLELPAMNSPVGYALGFVAATSALHGAGYALARWMPLAGAALIRGLGMIAAGAGALMLAS
ncbi:HupE/UreJ family protein [Pseudomonas sp. nanlin1]|uniref:HupE/UreJ family protein n=1 Tax=Pseudomonas sp. nanlin1 TaxID=3040605 RepID=UPI00388D1403